MFNAEWNQGGNVWEGGEDRTERGGAHCQSLEVGEKVAECSTHAVGDVEKADEIHQIE